MWLYAYQIWHTFLDTIYISLKGLGHETRSGIKWMVGQALVRRVQQIFIIFLNCIFNIILNYQVLNLIVPKAFEFASQFFKIGEIGPGQNSKVRGVEPFAAGNSKDNCSLETYLTDLNLACLALAGFQKLSVQLREICYPIGAKDLSSLLEKKHWQIKKAFGAKQLKTFQVKKL